MPGLFKDTGLTMQVSHHSEIEYPSRQDRMGILRNYNRVECVACDTTDGISGNKVRDVYSGTRTPADVRQKT